jgi:hypothetical protein
MERTAGHENGFTSDLHFPASVLSRSQSHKERESHAIFPLMWQKL